MTSLYKLRQITDEETAKTIWDMIQGDRDPCDVSELCASWVAQCYHVPSRREQVMCAADDLLGTCGVEGEADDDGRDGVSYCNTGDTYERTLFLDHGTFRVSSVATMAGSL